MRGASLVSRAIPATRRRMACRSRDFEVDSRVLASCWSQDSAPCASPRPWRPRRNGVGPRKARRSFRSPAPSPWRNRDPCPARRRARASRSRVAARRSSWPRAWTGSTAGCPPTPSPSRPGSRSTWRPAGVASSGPSRTTRTPRPACCSATRAIDQPLPSRAPASTMRTGSSPTSRPTDPGPKGSGTSSSAPTTVR